MHLYINIENGVTKNHPACEDNLVEVFGTIPESWEPFTRIERPVPGTYQVLESDESVYAKVDGVWTDVWTVRDMTTTEKHAKQQSVHDVFNARDQVENWSAWIFDELTCRIIPPIPRPVPNETKIKQGIYTVWCGADVNWKDTPVRPEGNYKFDFLAWQWVQDVN